MNRQASLFAVATVAVATAMTPAHAKWGAAGMGAVMHANTPACRAALAEGNLTEKDTAGTRKMYDACLRGNIRPSDVAKQAKGKWGCEQANAPYGGHNCR
ncbi:MAG: hypothetical protein H6922_06215 [Pseudomonadaceae bacterium]|nr:hypothetical protein [Pseudomonadaceae bacterium]